MNKRNILLGSVVVLMLMATVLASPVPICCTYISGAGCQGSCGSGTCLPVVGAFQTCACQTTTTTTATTTTTTTTTLPPETCGLIDEEDTFRLEGAYEVGGRCGGTCANGGTCLPTEPTDVVGTPAPCYCKPPVPVPEFATGLVALAVMLLSPAFAYLAVRRRH